MSALLKIRALFFGILVVSPAVAVWTIRGSDSGSSRPEVRPISNNLRANSTVRVPVEVIAKGSAPQWVYIEVAGQALPETRPLLGTR